MNLLIKSAIPIQIMIIIGIGLMIDGSRELTQPDLFWAFHIVSLMGIGTFLGFIWMTHRSWKIKIGYCILSFFVWRITYFPHLVFAGFITTLVEASYTLITPKTGLIYPIFLISLWILHGMCLGLLNIIIHPISTQRTWVAKISLPRWIIISLGLPALLVATLVSFSTPDDIHIFPDYPWHISKPLPPAGIPNKNPYLPKFEQAHRSVPSRVLLLCAGITYEFIPHSPWAYDVKGTLSELVQKRPYASTTERLEEHYLAYLVAHRRLF